MSPKGISPDVSNMSHSDWESIYEHKRVTRAPTNNKSATVTCADDELSSDPTSKQRYNEGHDSHNTSIPNFVKNYASLSQSTIYPKETTPIKPSSLKDSSFRNVTPSPKKRNHSKAFGIERNTVVNVTNYSPEGMDEIFDKYFESTEMNKLFCPSEGETVQESITR